MIINVVNIALMMLAMAVSLWKPYECFVLVYAFLGPAHYLTQISWMHDRNYFTTGKFDPIILVFPAIVITLFEALSYPSPLIFSFFVIWISFGGAMVMTFNRNWGKRLFWFSILTVIATLLTVIPFWLTVLCLLLPTIVHVYVFTGLFILSGALKTRSISGYVSFFFYLICGALPFLVNVHFSPENLSPYFMRAFSPFQALELKLNYLIQGETNGGSAIVLISFSYLYHYLNWFSKTKIIKWHETPPRRLVLIIALYAFFIGLYLLDYSKGFAAILGLSVAHVLLEFPLNFRCMSDISKRLLLRSP